MQVALAQRQVAKICNNMLLDLNGSTFQKALQIRHRQWLGTLSMSDIIVQKFRRNWTLELYNPWPRCDGGMAPSSNGYQGGFWSILMNKILGLAIGQLLSNNQICLPLGPIG